MPELSPASIAVDDALAACIQLQGEIIRARPLAAAALRAAADQVVPEEPLHGGDQRWMFERDARQACRKKLLAIAAELKAQ
jgi:hypothetical protein